MKQSVKLTAVNYENATGKFLVKQEGNKRWKVYTVNIDPFLMYRISNINKERKLTVNQRYIDYEFTAEVDSPSYRANPFLLKHFVPTKDSNIVEHYTLDTVDHYTVNLRREIRRKMVDYDAVAHLLCKFNREIVKCIVTSMHDVSKPMYTKAKVGTLKA